MVRWMTAWSALSAGCVVQSRSETPCDDLQRDIQQRYDDCATPVPDGVIDGTGCAVDEEEAACRSGCYADADCGALDDSDAGARDDLARCIEGCG
jgi:hypothetical protein